MLIKTFAVFCSFAALASHSAYAQFRHFDAISEKKDCRIDLNFPVGKFCGTDVRPENVRGWFLGDGTPLSDQSWLFGHKFNFSILVFENNTVRTLPIVFLNPSTAKRFYLQMEVWSGKAPAGGTKNPFPDSLGIAD